VVVRGCLITEQFKPLENEFSEQVILRHLLVGFTGYFSTREKETQFVFEIFSSGHVNGVNDKKLVT